MATPPLALKLSLVLLMADALIEMAFISSMVRWLHTRAGRSFTFTTSANQTHTLHGKPLHLLVNQGHLSNGAAGTAFILIGFLGILALHLRHHVHLHPHNTRSRTRTLSLILYTLWLSLTLLSTLLSFSALITTFILTTTHSGQKISATYASTLPNAPYPHQVPYPRDSWTPENWFHAVLQLPLTAQSDIDTIKFHLRIMQAWKWNLIPLVVLGAAVCGTAVADAVVQRRRTRREREGERGVYVRAAEGKRVSV